MLPSWVYAVVVGFVVLAFVIAISRSFGKGGMAARKAGDFSGALCSRTGLVAGADAFTGTYKGLEYHVKISLGMNVMDVIHMLGRPGRMGPYPRLRVQALKQALADEAGFPHTVLKQDLNPFVHTDQRIQDWVTGKNADLPPAAKALDKQLPRISVYTDDPGFAGRLVEDSELKRLLNDWYYAHITLQGSEIVLLLDHEHVISKYRHRLSTPDYIIQAMDIVARLAAVAQG
jgi:hypothetical protein